MQIDAVVVGAGIWGCTLARRLAEAGRKVLVVEKRPVVGGNCRCEIDDETGIEIHKYAPTAVKKSFCGKGNAGKDLMVAAYKDKYNVSMEDLLHKTGVGSPVSDVVDSHAMLYHHFNVNISSANEE